MGTDEPSRWTALLDEAAEIVWPLGCKAITVAKAPLVAASAMAVRVSRLLRASSLLIAGGYVSESAGLVRSIWEDAVSAAFIAEKPEERSLKWVEFADRRAVHHAVRDIQNPRLGTQTAKDFLASLPDEPALCGADWAGTSASSLARGLKSSKVQTRALLGEDFDLYYEILCDEAHGSPFAVGQLLLPGADAAVVDVGPDDHRIAEMSGLAMYGAWQFGSAASCLGLELDEPRLQDLVLSIPKFSSGSD